MSDTLIAPPTQAPVEAGQEISGEAQKPFDWAESSPELTDTNSEKRIELIGGFTTQVEKVIGITESIKNSKRDNRLSRSGTAQLNSDVDGEKVPIDLGEGKSLTFKDFITPNMGLLKIVAKDKLNAGRTPGRTLKPGDVQVEPIPRPGETEINNLAETLALEQINDARNIQTISYESTNGDAVSKTQVRITKGGEWGISHNVAGNAVNIIVDSSTGEIIKVEIEDRNSSGEKIYVTLDPESDEALNLLGSAIEHISGGVDKASEIHASNIKNKVAGFAISSAT